MKIISWNVNGLRACLQKGFLDVMKQTGADVFCVQETKMMQGQAEVDLSGQTDSSPGKYFEYWNSAEKKGYSGTAVFSKLLPLNHAYGIGIDRHDTEGRVITLEFEGFYLVNVYTPNSGQELARLDYRLRWEEDFLKYVCRLDAIKPVIICGDLNVAHNEIDLANPKSNVNSAGYTIQERDALTGLLNAGFTDFFRYLYPDKRGAYTWWSYRARSREQNIGWRIDYFLGSDRLTDAVTDVFIMPETGGSDHCPVGLVIQI